MPIFNFINRKVPSPPSEEGVEGFQASARKDQSRVAGWTWRPGCTPVGTLFALHGFTDHCRHRAPLEVARKHNLALVAIDLRHHGHSGDRWPSFGTGESWDLRGAMDKAEELGFPKPFIVMGNSLGAMGAQRAAVKDTRITGCFLAEPPQCPMHAIGSVVWKQLPPMAKFIK